MFIKKNGIMYNLNQYAKVYPDFEFQCLCLADVQGDFDKVSFESGEELERAYDLISNYGNIPAGMSKEDLPEVINLDEPTPRNISVEVDDSVGLDYISHVDRVTHNDRQYIDTGTDRQVQFTPIRDYEAVSQRLDTNISERISELSERLRCLEEYSENRLNFLQREVRRLEIANHDEEQDGPTRRHLTTEEATELIRRFSFDEHSEEEGIQGEFQPHTIRLEDNSREEERPHGFTTDINEEEHTEDSDVEIDTEAIDRIFSW